MRVTEKEYNGNKLEVVEFMNIADLRRFCADSDLNRFGRARQDAYGLASRKHDSWSGVPYEEAVTMLTEGWRVESEKLNAKLKASDYSRQLADVKRKIMDVRGFAPIVPLAIQGIPTCMVSRKKFKGRDRVLTITKSISYNASVEPYEIERESLKCLAIVRTLEHGGYSVNLNVMFSVQPSGHSSGNCYQFKVRIKNANERMNLSKVSFPMVHPSFLRRIIFEVMEKYPGVPVRGYKSTYGRPISDTAAQKLLEPREILLPAFVDRKLAEIRDVDGLANALNVM